MRKSLYIVLIIVICTLLASFEYAESKGLFKPKLMILYPAGEIKELKKQTIKPKIEVLSEIEKIAGIIYQLESSNGKNNFSKCESQGKFNNIGFGIYSGKYICFDSHDEEMETLANWIEKNKARGLSFNEILCFYNSGKRQGQANGASYQKYCNNS